MNAESQKSVWKVISGFAGANGYLIAVIISIFCLCSSSILFKYCADLPSQMVVTSAVIFVTGLLIGLLGAFARTFALKNKDANLVFATIGGPGSILLQICVAVVFRQTVYWWQWVAIVIITVGSVLLCLGPTRSPVPDEPVLSENG